MATLTAVDPGVQRCGFSFFKDQQLLDVCWIPAWSLWAEFLRSVWGSDLAIERMVIYPQSKGDPNDLLRVAEVSGALAWDFTNVYWYEARKWKGQVPKAVMGKRILKCLTEEELKVLGPLAKNHNVLDAVGIGLYHLGRLK